MNALVGSLFARAAAVRLRAVGVGAVLAVTVASATSCSDLTGSDRDLQVLWPRDGATLSGEELLRARVRGRDLDEYDIYWYVDDGREYIMWDEWDDGTPYKADLVDTWYWDWNGRGPYEVGFVAEDYSGREIARRRVRVYVE